MQVTVKLKYSTISKVCDNLLEVKAYVVGLMEAGHDVISYTYEYKGKQQEINYKG